MSKPILTIIQLFNVSVNSVSRDPFAYFLSLSSILNLFLIPGISRTQESSPKVGVVSKIPKAAGPALIESSKIVNRKNQRQEKGTMPSTTLLFRMTKMSGPYEKRRGQFTGKEKRTALRRGIEVRLDGPLLRSLLRTGTPCLQSDLERLPLNSNIHILLLPP